MTAGPGGEARRRRRSEPQVTEELHQLGAGFDEPSDAEVVGSGVELGRRHPEQRVGLEFTLLGQPRENRRTPSWWATAVAGCSY